jgi:hypothetical protein
MEIGSRSVPSQSPETSSSASRVQDTAPHAALHPLRPLELAEVLDKAGSFLRGKQQQAKQQAKQQAA